MYKILVVPSDVSGGVGFYRSSQPHKQLVEQFGDEFSVDIKYNFDWKNLDELKTYDLVHVHKGVYEDMNSFHRAIEFCHENKIATMLDIDDLWRLDKNHPGYYSNKYFGIDRMITDNFKRFDVVTCTTDIFAKEIERFTKNVKVFPNAINPEDERFKITKNPSNRLRIGFVMGSTHEHDMELIGKITKNLTQDELNRVQFVLCGFDLRGQITMINPVTKQTESRPIKPTESVWYKYEQMVTSDYSIVSKPYEMFLKTFVQGEYPNVQNEPYRRCWTMDMDNYYKHYQNVDVLFVPLNESDFNKVKSPLKVAECVFSNTAIVASEFGPYTIDLVSVIDKGGAINDEGNALLIPKSKAHKLWLKYIKKLINEPQLVKKLQNNLHNQLADKYDLRNVTEDRRNFYNELIQKVKNGK